MALLDCSIVFICLRRCMRKDLDFGKKYRQHNPSEKYPVSVIAHNEYIASTAEYMRDLLSFNNPHTSALHFHSLLFGPMSVSKDVLSQEMHKKYSAEDILDFFSFLPHASHVIIFKNTSPVLLRLKSDDGIKKYDLPLDLFWE